MSEPWYETLLSDSRDVVRRLMGERLLDVSALKLQVDAYADHVQSAAGPMTDLDQALALTSATRQLLDVTASSSPRTRLLAQVAARYLVLQDDGDDDLWSPYGFDDDTEVFNAVVQTLGMPQRAIASE